MNIMHRDQWTILLYKVILNCHSSVCESRNKPENECPARAQSQLTVRLISDIPLQKTKTDPWHMETHVLCTTSWSCMTLMGSAVCSLHTPLDRGSETWSDFDPCRLLQRIICACLGLRRSRSRGRPWRTTQTRLRRTRWHRGVRTGGQPAPRGRRWRPSRRSRRWAGPGPSRPSQTSASARPEAASHQRGQGRR